MFFKACSFLFKRESSDGPSLRTSSHHYHLIDSSKLFVFFSLHGRVACPGSHYARHTLTFSQCISPPSEGAESFRLRPSSEALLRARAPGAKKASHTLAPHFLRPRVARAQEINRPSSRSLLCEQGDHLAVPRPSQARLVLWQRIHPHAQGTHGTV
jgi:hypothetical protein